MGDENIIKEILIDNLKREKYTISKHGCKSRDALRKYPEREPIPDRENIRQSFSHDTDRIIHSLAYTRYIDKTQVFYLFENDHITHRVLHVQIVSKIARQIGRCMHLNEDLIEAISLGHDLGHVPFGHDGETILNELCIENAIGYFCHNAQSARTLMELENEGKGLNLSLQVLDGILAHNGEILSRKYEPQKGKTWDQFEKEYKGCFKEKDFSKKIVPGTLEGCVMRVSDIIAYIGRDIEDAITVGLIERTELPLSITRILGSENREIINSLVMDLIKNSYGKGYLMFSDDVYKALNDLKTFNYENIYQNPKVRTEASKIHNMFRNLFDCYANDLENNNSKSAVFSNFLKFLGDSYKKNTAPKRIAIDFISGMTDDFFNNQFYELFVPKSYGYSLKN
jgi:dGTPase